MSDLVSLLSARFFSALGYFSFLFFLALLFLEPPFQFNIAHIATLVGVLALTDRGAGILWSSFVNKLGFKKSLQMGLLITFFCSLSVCFFHGYIFCLIALIGVGSGLSLESLASRLWAASLSSSKEKILCFSSLHRVINASAVVASLLLFHIPYQKFILHILLGIGACFAISFLIITFCFRSSMQPSMKIPSFLEIVRIISKDNAVWCYSLLCLSVFGWGLYVTSQQHLLPFYFKECLRSIPSYMGWIIALNPIMIVFLQGGISRLFLYLQNRMNALGILLGLVFNAVAFSTLSFMNPLYGVWFFVIFISLGEMLIIPHVDYLLSLRLSSEIRPLIFSLSGIAFSLGRSLSEGIGIFAIGHLAKSGTGTEWWLANLGVSVFVVMLGGILIVSKLKSPILKVVS
ncbi:MAG: hypothetical protein Q7T03_05365 [Deltaproteobacteria bacterium]|nr:hypothetical protein [Deltaproteobacteria bacterium]